MLYTHTHSSLLSRPPLSSPFPFPSSSIQSSFWVVPAPPSSATYRFGVCRLRTVEAGVGDPFKEVKAGGERERDIWRGTINGTLGKNNIAWVTVYPFYSILRVQTPYHCRVCPFPSYSFLSFPFLSPSKTPALFFPFVFLLHSHHRANRNKFRPASDPCICTWGS